MNTLHIVVSALIVLLGLIHCLFTFANFREFTMDAFWFLGSGIATLLAGFLNVAVIRDCGRDGVIWLMAMIANVTFLVLFVLATFMLGEPQVFFGLLLFTFTTFRNFSGEFQPNSKNHR